MQCSEGMHRAEPIRIDKQMAAQSLTEIMYGLFLQSLGYAKDLDLSELEIALEEKGQLEEFEAEYRRLFNKEWSIEKGKVAFALSEASRVIHSLDTATYP